MIKSLYRVVRHYVELIALNFSFNQSKFKERYDTVIIKTDGIGDFIVALKFFNKLQSNDAKTLIITSGVVSELSKKFFEFDILIIDPLKFSKLLKYRLFLKRILYSISSGAVIVPIVSRVFSTVDVLADAIDSPNKYAIAGNYSNISRLEAKLSNNFYNSLYFLERGDQHETIVLDNFFKFIFNNGNISSTNSMPMYDLLGCNNNKINNFERYVVISPGSSELKKNWSPENYKMIVSYLVSKKINIVFVGGGREESICQEISSGIPMDAFYNACGETSLVQSFKIISNADLLIGNDSSMIHAAIALGVKCICIAGGGHWGRFIPYPSTDKYSSLRVLTRKMDCFGCNWRCIKVTDNNTIYPCISGVSVDSVIQEICDLYEV